MPCSFFAPEPACRCAAVTGSVIPSIYERERFCRAEQGFVRCPTFRAQAARGDKLAERDYYALWMVTDVERNSETAVAVSTGLGQT
jgi:hypothetical protein